MNSRNLILPLALASTMASACGGGAASAGDETTPDAPVASQYEGGVVSTDTDRGNVVYDQMCGVCHPGTAPELANLGWSASQTRQQVREGGEGMPPFTTTRLTPEDLEAVLAYMATIGAVTE